MIITALEGTGMTIEELSSWSTFFVMISNLFGNPYKLTTVALVALAFFIPKVNEADEKENAQERGMTNQW